MKYLKLFESFEEIHEICKRYNIRNYTINNDGSIDVNGRVELLKKIIMAFNLRNRNFLIFRDEDTDTPAIVMDRLNDFLLTIGRPEVENVYQYKNI